MPFFKTKSKARSKLPPEERLVQVRTEHDAQLAKDRAKFDRKNVGFRKVSAAKLAEIRTDTDEHIERIRDLVVQDYPIELASGVEAHACIIVRFDEQRAIIDAEYEQRRTARSAKYEQRRTARSVKSIITQATLGASSEAGAHDHHLIRQHNKAVFKEWLHEVRDIKDDLIIENRRVEAQNRLQHDSFNGKIIEMPDFSQRGSIPDDEDLQGPPPVNYHFSDVSRFTMDNFNLIENGMSLADITHLLGDEGNLKTYDYLQRYPEMVPFEEALESLEVRIWMASVPPQPTEKNPIKGLIQNITIGILFRDGVVVAKYQYGLRLRGS